MSGVRRLRIFAGPNGSGKSTVIQSVRHLQINGKPIDFGTYINADDIAQSLRQGGFFLHEYGINNYEKIELLNQAQQSGMIRGSLSAEILDENLSLFENRLSISDHTFNEPIAQIVAECLRRKLLQQAVKFSFETVFSHPSKIDFIRECVDNGYKVYLYFAGPKSPDINVFRVKSRVAQGGHDVPIEKIVRRYFNSMENLWEAAQLCHRVFIFDNSEEGDAVDLFADFKQINGEKVWNIPDENRVPDWFKTYYSQKVQ